MHAIGSRHFKKIKHLGALGSSGGASVGPCGDACAASSDPRFVPAVPDGICTSCECAYAQYARARQRQFGRGKPVSGSFSAGCLAVFLTLFCSA